MAQDHNEPQAFAQMFECVPQAAENVVAKAVAGNPDNKQVVWSVVKDQLDRHPRVRTPEHDGKRMLRLGSAISRPVVPVKVVPRSAPSGQEEASAVIRCYRYSHEWVIHASAAQAELESR